MISLPDLPHLVTEPLTMQVTAAAERLIRHGSPWLWQEVIRRQNRPGLAGEWAVVLDRKQKPLAVGLYDPTTPLRVRLFPAGTPIPPDAAWLAQRLAAANQLRLPLTTQPTTGYRIVHGENDGLPGLVLDRYDQTLVLKLYTSAWIPHLRWLLPTLATALPYPRLVLRLSARLSAQPELLFHLQDGLTLWGDKVDDPVAFTENGLKLTADVVAGLRTGFYFDQRDNRHLVETMSAGKSVLVGYAHTGSFSLAAARGGARQVVSLSASQPALGMALRHFQLNKEQGTVAAADHELLVGDVLLTLNHLHQTHRRFDMVVFTPPPLAPHPADVERGLDLYGKLCQRGLRLLRPQGLFLITSRSGAITADTFYETIHQAADRVWHSLTEIQRTGLPPDHPVTFPSAAYLKGLLAQVA